MNALLYNEIMDTVKGLSDFKESLKSLLPELNQKYSVLNIGIFGSYVRQEQSEESDLDILVTFESPPSLFKFIELENFLSDSLSVKVDLIMEDAIKPNLKKRILQEVVMI